MKRGVNPHGAGEQEVKGDGVNPSNDLEGTNETWCQFAGLNPQWEIPSREPHPLTNPIGWGWAALLVCVVLLPRHSLLKGRTNTPPGGTTPLDELSSRGHPDISLLLWEQWWLISILTLKGGETRGCVL